MTVAMDALRDSATTRVTSIPYGHGAEILSTPWDFPDGETVTLLVRELGPDHFYVSDQGSVSRRLAIVGVDLTRGIAARSWELIKDGLPLVFAESHWAEMAATTTQAGLGDALWDVSSRALQAEGLAVLGRPRPRARFGDQIMRQAAGYGLAVHPRDRIGNRFGATRHVTFSATGERTAYVVAVGHSGGFTEDFDRVRGVFGDSPQLSLGSKVIALSDKARPAGWQTKAMAETGRVVQERDLPALWDELAA